MNDVYKLDFYLWSSLDVVIASLISLNIIFRESIIFFRVKFHLHLNYVCP